jgi:hypothetical protein
VTKISAHAWDSGTLPEILTLCHWKSIHSFNCWGIWFGDPFVDIGLP